MSLDIRITFPLLILLWGLFYMWPVSPNTRIAFGFMIHNEETLKGFEQFLFNYYSTNHHYLVHFDKKMSKIEFEQFNVHVVDQQINAKWGRYSLLYSELLLLKMSREFKYDYLYFLDGMTVPLRPLSTLENYLANLNPEACAVFDEAPSPACKYDHSACQRTRARCVDDDCTKYDITPNNAPIYKESQWIMLSRPFIEHMFSSTQWFTSWLNFFKHTGIPDESFFHTLLMDSKFNETQLFENPMFTKWTDCYRNPTRKGSSPCWLMEQDFIEVITADKWFARKLSLNSSLRDKLYLGVRKNQ
eukprot:NODE_251_length_12882_cov_0.075334.p4 type:complete len:302 gc:universal NODE_251_length_12882_cov_0.075334:1392-487(-)